MAQEDAFKITYATLSAPSEEMHLEYDRAIDKVRKGMGNTHAMWIDGREVSGLKAILLDKTHELKVGDPLARDTFMGPLISKQACRNFERYVADATGTERSSVEESFSPTSHSTRDTS